jgi:hypothetical protein
MASARHTIGREIALGPPSFARVRQRVEFTDLRIYEFADLGHRGSAASTLQFGNA